MAKRSVISVLSLLVLITLIAFTTSGGCGGGSSKPKFPEPKVLQSINGVLRTTLETLIGTNAVENVNTNQVDIVETPSYQGQLIGPTYKVEPGDTLDITFQNNLPPNPSSQRMGAFPHDPYTTNFHTHGLSVSPRGISDNVLRLMEPGSENPIEVEIPEDHACGTFWYHPHKHGSVSFQFFGGMFGFLIIDREDCGLNQIPEIAAAKNVVMGIGIVRTDQNGQVPFVNMEAENFSQNPGIGVTAPSLWQFFRDSKFYITVNGVINPTLRMRPGEVQRWRILNAASGETLVIALEGHSMSAVAADGLNLSQVVNLGVGEGYVMGVGNRVDMMIQAGLPGIYRLQVLDPSTPRSISSLAGIDPAKRDSRIGGDFPTLDTYPHTLATIVVEGNPVDMDLPSGALPAPRGLPSIQQMQNAEIAETRNVSFEICSPGTQNTLNEKVNDVCTYYFDRYDEDYWQGTFNNLIMMRDADDTGIPNPAEGPPFIFLKEGLFTAGAPLYSGLEPMVTGTFEEWTVLNRSNSDHPFHIHQNPFLLTHINGVELERPEWHDTILVPAADTSGGGNIVDNAGSVTFRTWFDPITYGTYVMHCHILTHEDVGMMQELVLEQAE